MLVAEHNHIAISKTISFTMGGRNIDKIVICWWDINPYSMRRIYMTFVEPIVWLGTRTLNNFGFICVMTMFWLCNTNYCAPRQIGVHKGTTGVVRWQGYEMRSPNLVNQYPCMGRKHGQVHNSITLHRFKWKWFKNIY